MCTLYLIRTRLFSNLMEFNLKFESRRCKSTIFALSSGQGKCGVAVIRVSGPKSCEVYSKMTNLKKPPPPRRAMLLPILDSETQLQLDTGIVLWFPAPNSFTGEHCCELQVHGGLAVVSSVLASLGKLKDFQPASPGEFTRRAFYANKLDLTEVEGLADLIEAETEFQRRQALYQMEGNLSHLYSSWRETLSRCLAFVEAYIDFSEEENIDDNILQKVDSDLKELCRNIEIHLRNGRKGERLRSGVQTSILGAPNVGKSSLLNTLCERPAAIVTEIPGTTRDVIETTLNINGYPVILADTAGIRADSVDPVEIEGISRAFSASEKSDLLLFLLDASHFFNFLKNRMGEDERNSFASVENFYQFFKEHIFSLHLDGLFTFHSSRYSPDSEKNSAISNHTKSDAKFFDHAPGNTFPVKCSKNYLIILNKVDLLASDEKSFCYSLSKINKNIIPISCKTEENLQHLVSSTTDHLSELCGNPSQESPILSQVRHRYHINECYQAIEQYFLNSDDERIVMGAEHLRTAINSLGQITGHVSSEELLNIIFKQFCIGK